MSFYLLPTNEDEFNRCLMQAFLLGSRITNNAYPPGVTAADTKSWDLLCAVASGDQAIVTTGAEWELKFPNMRPDQQSKVNRLVQADRELAGRILSGYNRASE